jgi:hypothetical protein
MSSRIIDDLRVHMFVTFENSQPGALACAGNLLPNPADTLGPSYGLGICLSHCNLPFSLLLTCSTAQII